jgi:hypothetical protein
MEREYTTPKANVERETKRSIGLDQKMGTNR